MTTRFLAPVLLLSAAAPLAAAAGDSTAPRVVVGPNILVSRDGDVPHVELMVATSPRSGKHLLGGAITATRPNGGMACRTYSSTDGGTTWKASEFPEQVEFGGADPQVAFTARGTALFVALTLNKSERGKDCASMHVWRSEDAGKSWLPSTEIPCRPSWDHEQIVVDQTAGRFAGRIYLVVLYDYPVYRVGVFRSDDDGRSWTGPVEAANGGGKIGINDVTPMVLSDGTLIVPYGDFQFLPDKRPKDGTNTTSNLRIVSSSDGGVTFSKPANVVAQNYHVDYGSPPPIAGFPKFATSGASKSHPDRLYVVWEDYQKGPYRILFSRSTDRGKTWSPPKPIDAKVPASTHQFQPAVAINGDGLVAVTWYDTRDSSDGNAYHQYFAASTDGGESFLPTVRVSSEPSRRKGAGNGRISPVVWSDPDGFYLSMLSATSRWESGGDYMGLAADRDGGFHPFWADSRSGTFQIYTASVRPRRAASEEGGESRGAESTRGETAEFAARRVLAPRKGRVSLRSHANRSREETGRDPGPPEERLGQADLSADPGRGRRLRVSQVRERRRQETQCRERSLRSELRQPEAEGRSGLRIRGSDRRLRSPRAGSPDESRRIAIPDGRSG